MTRLDVLVISNMLPSASRPSFGIFAAQRADSYRALGATVRLVGSTTPAGLGLRSALKYVALTLRALGTGVRRRPDIVDAHYLVPTGLIGAIVAALTRSALAVTVHGSDVLALSGRRVAIAKWLLRRCDVVIANSPATAEAVRLLHEEATICVAPPGIGPTGISPASAGSSAEMGATAESGTAGLAVGAPQVAFVGTLHRYKGPDVLVEALGELPEYRARIAGFGPEGPALRALAEQVGVSDRIEWLGEVEPGEVPAVFASADIGVMPSRREGFGRVAVEALAAGTPVVVADVGGLPWIVDETCGLVVPPDDPGALAEAIRRLANAGGEMAEACRRRARDFEELILARRALDSFESAVAQPRKAAAHD